MSEHNYRQRCTEQAGCTCSKCCLCRTCLFDRRSASLYRGMQSRFGEKKFKSGKREGDVRREKRPIPYTLEQFRAWLTVVLEDQPCCEYCSDAIDIMTISPDHSTPISRGGSLGLPNLRGCCDPCNRTKGNLLPGEYKALLAGLKTFTEAGRGDVLRRLRGAAVHFHNKPKAAATVAKKAETNTVLAFPPMRGTNAETL